MVPAVTPIGPRDVLTEAAHDDAGLDLVGLAHRLVGALLQRDRLAAAVVPVAGDEHAGLRVLDPVDDHPAGEPREDDRVDRADAGAGEHRDRQLGDHRQVDADAIALADPQVPQRVRELRHLVTQLRIGDVAGLSFRLADPVEGDVVAVAVVDVPVEAVVARVELPAEEPLCVRWVPLQYRASTESHFSSHRKSSAWLAHQLSKSAPASS